MRVTRNATGLVRHLNAAVVVNQKVNTDAKGKTTSTPLTQDEMDKLTALVQEAIGFDKTRGDSVKVINAPFKAEAAMKAEELPLWKQQWLLDLLRAGAVPTGLTLVALAVLFGLVRPAVMAALAPAGRRAEGRTPERRRRRRPGAVDGRAARAAGGAAHGRASSRARASSPRTTRPPSPTSCATGSTAKPPPDSPRAGNKTMALPKATRKTRASRTPRSC